MLINIKEALEAALPLEVTIDGAKVSGLAHQGQVEGQGDVVPDTLDFSFSTPVTLQLEFQSTGRDLIINGNFKCELTLQCSRCLKDYATVVDSNFTYFAPLAEEPVEKKGKADKRKSAKESDSLSDEESRVERELSHIEDGDLNASALVLEEVTLRLPTKPLCDEACKGLCLSCGIDLNTNKCKCADNEEIDPRLAKLKEFKIKQ
jgi:uncharacterized protein